MDLTPKISRKILRFHFTLFFYAFIVQVSVQHDYSKRQQEDSVSTTKGADDVRITLTVLTRERLESGKNNTCEK